MTINGSTNNNQWTYKLEVSETGYSVQNRTSTIQVKTYLGRASSQSYLGGNYSNSVSITGASSQSQSGNIPYPTYINGGAWLLLKTFTFTVPNTGNPTTVTISSSFSSGDFTPSSASASGTMQLTILHLDPVINTATMVETNSVLTALNVPNTTIVRYLSKKTITLSVTTYDSATPTYRLRHFNIDYAIPSSSTYQNSATFNTDYTTHDIAISNDGKANLIQDIKDSLNGTATDWVTVNIGGTAQKPNGISYAKPSIERANTSIKRKSGGGTTLTDNKAVLNFKGTFYKGNDVIGNNNSITQIGYKIWEKNTTEPSNYTTLTPTISGGNITISNLELSGLIYTKTYNYKIILKDRYDYQDAILNGTLPTGESVWTEYKDRIDVIKLNVGGYNPFEYSTSETKCGIWTNGKPLYRKVIDMGSLVNNSSKSVAHGLTNFVMRKIEGSATNGTFHIGTSGFSDEVYIDSSNIVWNTKVNRTAFSGYVIIEYTKTTD